MDEKLYNRIVSLIKNYQGLSKDCLKEMQTKFPHQSFDTLYSILCLEYQKRMKCNYSKSQTGKTRFWELYKKAIGNRESPGIIIRLSEKYDICPCLMGKLILQKYFEEVKSDDRKEHAPQLNLNNYLKNTNTIPNMDLAYEIFLCTVYDNLYSPLANTMKMSLGQQYEIKLHNEAVKLGLAFQDEENLRKFGYDKTPDCKLDVPVAIDGFIINWIESKALFGDQEGHNEYKKNQYLSYWNRFGPGLVIYWFGFSESIVEPLDKRFIIRDTLPTNIVHLNSSLGSSVNKHVSVGENEL